MWDLKFWWVKPVAVLAVCAALLCSGWLLRGWKDKAERFAEQEAAMQAIQAANQRAVEADLKLQAKLSEPKAGPVIREVVRANPSDCHVAAPVVDGLRSAIRNTNASTR